ncbi:NLR family CARD domain-containing protein 3-like [Silurus meridionalis]|uniref:NLR family CARD domain-containing protein 3-like n=1 Tax=Silurus meridionalis TaxID=175797 RepID=UPI001EEBA916|nr:NLR family CARD domain-containing protein 3-like [Silurus meridionalis]
MEIPDQGTDHVTSPSKDCKGKRKRSHSPEPSCVSMKSDGSMEHPLYFSNENPSPVHSKGKRERSHSAEPSCVSMKSDRSMDLPLNFRTGISSPVHSVLQKAGDRREKIITATGHDPESTAADKFQKRFKLNLVKKFQCLNGLMLNQENQTLLNEIYTELYITEGDSGDVNKEHEVKQIEAASRRNPTEDTPIKCSDIFKPLPEQDKAIRRVLTKPLSEQDKEPIRKVLTKGVAGIGKTVSVQKFVLDWAEGKTNQDVHLIFPLPFRELNLMKEQKLSLVELLHVFFKEMKEMDISRLEKVLFIFDGLDECRFSLDFQKTVRVCDVTESAPVHVLLINLIKGNLLPSALIWITSRPAAADQIPSECVHRVTEVRGFNDPQKEEYFRKRISDQNLANKIITHLKSLRSLYIMCHIPVFCWISAAVLERMLGKAESGEIPKTLTQMYIHFLIVQTNIIREKYLQKQKRDEEMLLKLGKLAFQQLEKQNLIFYEEDLSECDIDVTEAAVYSGVCTQIFREEFGLHQSKVYCFVHLSIQEHLAALYVHLTFMKEQRNSLKQNQDCRTLSDVHRSAVDHALDSQTGHLDLFLRFLLGLSLESNQKLLHFLVTQTGSSSQNKEKIVQYVQEKISEDLPAEKSINLFHCLNELGDDSLVEEIQQYLKSGAQSELSPSQWSALVFVLLTSAQDLEEFDLNLGHLVLACPEDRVTLVSPSDRGKKAAEPAGVVPPVASARPAAESPVTAAAPGPREREPQAQPVEQRSTNYITTPEKPCSAEPHQEKPCSAEPDREKPSKTGNVTVDSEAVLELPALAEAGPGVQSCHQEAPVTTSCKRRHRVTLVSPSDRGKKAAEPAGVVPPVASARPAAESPVTAAAPGPREREPQAQPVEQRSTNYITTPEKPCSAEPHQEKPCSAEPDREKPSKTGNVTVDSEAVLELPALAEAGPGVQSCHQEAPTKSSYIKFERAQRTLASRPGVKERPRLLVVCMHNFRDKQRILDASRKLFMDENLQFENSKVSFYQDFSAAVLHKRREFDSAKHRLQEIGARYAMFYPAKQ